jgi:hypothetical protein
MSALLSRKAIVIPLIVATCVLAHDEGFAARYGRRRASNPHLRRGEPYPSGTDPAYSVPPLESIVPTPGGYTENTLPVESTYAAGAQPTMANFPALPSGTFHLFN